MGPPATSKPQQVETTKGWSVRPLSPLPPIYCLERTHLKIDDTAENVAERVSDCLRKESIATIYHKDENLVDAETVDHVNFAVRLWQGKNGTVLIEVQKVSGCCYGYCQAAKAVLRAAKGISTPMKRRTLSIPQSVLKVSDEESEAATRDGLEIAEQLFDKDELDAKCLATESLLMLSKSTDNQCLVARCILSGALCEKLMKLIGESMNSGNNQDNIQKEYVSVMRRHAFAIFSNCLGALEKSGELPNLLQNQKDLTSSGIISALVVEVAAASDRPHDACQAANCLATLLVASDDIKRKAVDLNAYETISEAYVTGKCRHMALEEACTQLRTLL